jgi:hypothetical protein
MRVTRARSEAARLSVHTFAPSVVAGREVPRRDTGVMASRTVVRFEDDIDGSKAAETISFGLDGVVYEIDLSMKNSEKLRRVLQRYTSASRRVGGRITRGDRGKGTARSDPAQLAAIREWARHNGYAVGDRGRVPTYIVEEYNANAGR